MHPVVDNIDVAPIARLNGVFGVLVDGLLKGGQVELGLGSAVGAVHGHLDPLQHVSPVLPGRRGRNAVEPLVACSPERSAQRTFHRSSPLRRLRWRSGRGSGASQGPLRRPWQSHSSGGLASGKRAFQLRKPPAAPVPQARRCTFRPRGTLLCAYIPGRSGQLPYVAPVVLPDEACRRDPLDLDLEVDVLRGLTVRDGSRLAVTRPAGVQSTASASACVAWVEPSQAV